MRTAFWKWTLIAGVWASLAACSSNHVLVKKADMEAADQCLLAQQNRSETIERQQKQLSETLRLLQRTIELQERGDTAVREFMQAAREGVENKTEQEDCLQEQSSGAVWPTPGGEMDKKVVGATERVMLTDLGILLQSRIDTGATTSSLDARDTEMFERDGDDWVRFKVYDPDMDQKVELERPEVRGVRVIQSGNGDGERRPVVEMRITIGSTTQVADFTLADRGEMEHPVLIGRNVLRDLMVVDVAQDNVIEPQPPKAAQRERERRLEQAEAGEDESGDDEDRDEPEDESAEEDEGSEPEDESEDEPSEGDEEE